MPPPAVPRIVFFGPPNAGKTALLSAFLRVAKAAETVPLTPAEAAPRDVVPHVVHADAPAGVVLIDTDGKTAAKLIADPGRFRPRPVRREPASVTAAVYAADALVLLVDASADDAELDHLFRDFGRLLEKLEEARTTEREVGGLPVFLTLTKCDAIRRQGDDPKEWLARIEERQREVRGRFEEYLADEAERSGPFGFGSIEVSVAATALRFPDAPGFAGLGGGPFGVEDLYRESTAAARAFRRRTEGAARRLRWTVAGAVGVVGVLAASFGFLVLYPGAGTESLLAARVRTFQERAGPPAVRLSDRYFAKNQAELTAIREAAGFDRLPAELREYVEFGVREFAAYKDYRDRFRPPRLGTSDVRSREELDRLDAALAGELAPPPGYAAAWAGTEAVRLWEKWKTDAGLLRAAEERLYEWYRGLLRRATGLQLVPAADYRWRRDVAALLTDVDSPPAGRSDPIPGSPKVPIRGGATLTYAPAFEFDRVAVARQDWENEKARLLNLRDLADALGLTAGPGTPPPVLDLPEPSSDLNESRALPGDRLRALRETYLSPSGDYREWAAGRFPDPIRGELRQRLDRAFDAGVRHARRLILDRLGPAAGKETHADWQPVAAWLDADPVMKQWGQLLGLTRRLADGDGRGDPVAELAEFLRKDHFDAVVRVIELTIPDDLRGQRAVPTGPFVLTVKSPDGSPREYRYRADGDPRRDGPASVARFVPDGHDGKMTFRPGDDVTAAVPLRAGGQEFELVWSDGRSRVYTFDRLARQPEVRRRDVPFAGERATGVRLVLLPPDGWPAVPPLLP
jgi:GTPase SAR1 family protein